MEPWCQCLGGVQLLLPLRLADGTFRTTENELPDADLAWARDTVVDYAKSLAADQRPAADRHFGSPDAAFGALRPLAVVVTNDSYAMIFAHAERAHMPDDASVPQLLVFVVVREPQRGTSGRRSTATRPTREAISVRRFA